MSSYGKTVKDFSKYFYEQCEANNKNFVGWASTYDIAVIKDSHLWKVFEAAMPHEVMVEETHYGNRKSYEKMYKWLEKNGAKGLFTHRQISFYFQYEEDAMAFKLVWGA